MLENAVCKYAVAATFGALLGCAAATRTLAQPSEAAGEATGSDTSSTLTSPRNDGRVDYEHAQPMPLPSVPGPAPAQTWPQPTGPSETQGHAEGSPGSEGTGNPNPQVLVPQKPSPQSGSHAR
jgi:hypothetical protein